MPSVNGRKVVTQAAIEAHLTNTALRRQIDTLFDLLQARPEELGPDARPPTATQREEARKMLQQLKLSRGSSS